MKHFEFIFNMVVVELTEEEVTKCKLFPMITHKGKQYIPLKTYLADFCDVIVDDTWIDDTDSTVWANISKGISATGLLKLSNNFDYNLGAINVYDDDGAPTDEAKIIIQFK